MKLKATQEVYIRSREPWIKSDNKKGVIYPGFEIEVVKEIEDNAQVINGNGKWYQDKNGDYYWSGGFESNESVVLKTSEQVESKDGILDWWFSDFGFPQVNEKATGNNVNIIVIDSGADIDHQWLKGHIEDTINFNSPENPVEDVTSHGSHICGIAAGKFGIATASKLYIYKVHLEAMHKGKLRDLGVKFEFILMALDETLKEIEKFKNETFIINMSLYVSGLSVDESEILYEKFQAIHSAGGIIVCAAKENSNSQGNILHPASFTENCISVEAINSVNSPLNTEIERYISKIDVLAPGENIMSAKSGGGKFPNSGSSMACAYVSGVVALICDCLQQNEAPISLEKVKNILSSSSDPIEIGSTDYSKIINPLKALKST